MAHGAETTTHADAGPGSAPAHDTGRPTVEFRRRTREAGDRPSEQFATATGSPWRGIAIGLAGVVALSVVTPYVEAYLQASPLATVYLPTGVVLWFLLLLALNVVLRRTRFALTPMELMLSYITMLVPATIPTEGFVLRLIPLLVGYRYYATPWNEWSILHAPHIPDWMVPNGPGVVDWFFLGMPAGESMPWRPWVKPLALWCVLLVALYMILSALSLAFRKRWMHAERLQFPLAQIPLMIMGDDPAPSLVSRFFRSPLVWVGAAIPFILHGLSGLALYFPVVPSITLTDLQLRELFTGARMWTEPPFFRWADVTLNFYWSVIGISYLLRSEVSLSVWAFEWFYRLVEIGFEIQGTGHGQYEFSPLHTFGYTLFERYARAGALIAASAAFFWASRAELREMVSVAFGRRKAKGDDPYEIPWWGFWIFLAGLGIYFAWTGATGMPILIAAILLAIFLAIALTTARVVAATGLLWVYDFLRPMQALTEFTGTARIDPHTFTNVGLVDFGALQNQRNIMPPMLDGMRIARDTGIRRKHFFIGIALGILVAFIVSTAVTLHIAYTYGGIKLDEWNFRGGINWLFDRVAGFQRYHRFTNWTVMGLMGFGGAFMSLLLWLHRTYLWWPLYPLGFIVAGSIAAEQIWWPVLLGWLLKRIVVRLAGAEGYRRFRSAAIGLVIGEFLAVAVWFIVDAATATTAHRVFPIWIPH